MTLALLLLFLTTIQLVLANEASQAGITRAELGESLCWHYERGRAGCGCSFGSGNSCLYSAAQFRAWHRASPISGRYSTNGVEVPADEIVC